MPGDEETAGGKLLVKAGFVSKLASGLYNFLPLGNRVLLKIEKIIRGELDKAGVIEILTPVLHPAKLWKDSGRFEAVGDELWKIKNPKGEEFVLAMTAEEVFSEIAKNNLQSYKDLPVILNQFQTKIRNEIRPRAGLLRTREFVMQDAYSFDVDSAGLDKSHDLMVKVYEKIFARLGIKFLKVEADVGAMGGLASLEFMVKNEVGEDEIVVCPKCGYAANIDKAECLISGEMVRNTKYLDREKVKTPRMISVVEVTEYLKTKEENVLKTLVFKILCTKKLVIAVIRGDLSINPKKLAGAIGAEVEMASEKDLEEADLMPGFVSPVELEEEIQVVADSSVKLMSNFVAGANERDYHFVNVNLSDFKPDIWTDLVQVKKGDKCKNCGSKLEIEKAIELGHTFKLGDKYSKSLGVKVANSEGKDVPVQMGCYGIGLGRAMAVIAEEFGDEKGINWPKSVAPFEIYLINISDLDKISPVVDKIYNDLEKAGFEVLYDDRDFSAGIKFADADLIGAPVRIVVSQKTLVKNAVEIKLRSQQKTELVPIENLIEELKK